MASHRKELKLGVAQRDIVNFSVKAQDQILRAAAEGMMSSQINGSVLGGGVIAGGYKTTDDLGSLSPTIQYPGISKILNSLSIGGTNLTTNISQEEASKMMMMGINRSVANNDGENLLLLPSIKQGRKQQASPFKGNNAFFDVPMMLTTQKIMRQTVRAAAGEKGQGKGEAGTYNPGHSLKIQSPADTAREFRSTHSADRNQSVKMNPKVLETWINETLQDAEHLDIPGVILKPEHKNPISRYGIDRLALTNAGIPNELVDRIFRALFVYSVGFYELVKKCLQHTERKYSIITAIWKVFSILLEYCCKTDYRMLISEISKEHKDEMDRMEREFQDKFGEQAANERILKQNMEILQKYTEELEKEKNSERQMRLKLEEEYMQNTKNHEEEVQLRLKFESKLNNMHSVHRDLETKYKRALSELAGLQTINDQLYSKNGTQAEEITALKTAKAEMESKISYNDEKIAGLLREVTIKAKQVGDLEGKFSAAQDELDMTKYKLQELQKDITEQKLKIDVFESQSLGLKNEKQHLLLELKETKDLQKVYEKKCGTLIQEVNKVNLEFQQSKREIIGFSEIQKEREDRIEKLKAELKEVKAKFEDVDLKHGTLCIQYDKVKDQYDISKRDLDDAIEKLHLTNKVRHETELKLSEEIERSRALQDVIRDKDEQLHKRAQEIEDLDRRVIDLERTNENIEIKKASLERQFEITKKQLSEKVSNLNEVLQSEKETREMWIERYEKEQKEHTGTNGTLLHTKSQLKDQTLATKNVEIKLQTTIKSNEVLNEQNGRLQDNLNESLAKQENLERDVNTQKEIMKQMEANRKEYIQKLKGELLTVESRFHQKMDQTEMVSQDFLSRAAKNFEEQQNMKQKYESTREELLKTKSDRDQRAIDVEGLQQTLKLTEMFAEDLESRIGLVLNVQLANQGNEINYLREAKENLEDNVEDLKLEIEQKQKLETEVHELEKEVKLQQDENVTLKKINEQLSSTVSQQQDLMSEQRQDFENQSRLLSDQFNPSQLPPANIRSEGSQGGLEKKTNSQPLVERTSSQAQIQPAASRPRQVGREVQVQTEILMRDLDRPAPYQGQQQQQNQSLSAMTQPGFQNMGTSAMGVHQGNQPQQLNIKTGQAMAPPHLQTQQSPFNQTQANTDLENTLGTMIQSPQNIPQRPRFEYEKEIDLSDLQDPNHKQYDVRQIEHATQREFSDSMIPQIQTLDQQQMQKQQYYQMNHDVKRADAYNNLTQDQYQQEQQQQYQQQQYYQQMPTFEQMSNQSQHSQMMIQNQYQQQQQEQQQPYPRQGSTHRNNVLLQQPSNISQGSHGNGSLHGAPSLNGHSVQRQTSIKMQVEYKNMNTVMNHNNSQSSSHSGAPGSIRGLAQKSNHSQFRPQNNTEGQFRPQNNEGSENEMQLNFPVQNSVNNSSPGNYPGQSQMMPNQQPLPQMSIAQQQQYQQQHQQLNQQQQQQQQQQHQQHYQQQQQQQNQQNQQNQQQQLQSNGFQPSAQVSDYLPQDPANGIHPQMAQAPPQSTRHKVDIISSYGDQRRNLNSGGGISVHTPMSQVSGYSQHLAPQNGRFQQQQQPPIIVTQTTNGGINTLTSPSNNAHHAGNMMSSSGGMASNQGGANNPGPQNSSNNNYPPGAIPDKDRKVTGKSSIRSLIKTAAMRNT